MSVSSSGRIVFRFIVPPTEPSMVLASGVLVTSIDEIIAALTSSKSIPPRPELFSPGLAPVSEPTVVTPFISTRLALVPRI